MQRFIQTAFAVGCLAALPAAPVYSQGAAAACLGWGIDRAAMMNVSTKLADLRGMLENQDQNAERQKMAQETVVSLSRLIDALDGVNTASGDLHTSVCP